mmetsp:Transcript_7106/g.12236  ORF Transcript_7106/g.12236 Transcript_7106/m.12236 type:complete len:91 (-) Transcript_7106:39-311(-)
MAINVPFVQPKKNPPAKGSVSPMSVVHMIASGVMQQQAMMERAATRQNHAQEEVAVMKSTKAATNSSQVASQSTILIPLQTTSSNPNKKW